MLLVGKAWCGIPSNDGNVGPKVSVTVEFGKKPNCIGWGICDIDITISNVLGSSSLSNGDGAGGGGGYSWILTISKEHLSRNYPHLLSYFEGKSQVVFPETFVASPQLKEALGSPTELVIKANTSYSMKLENGQYVINIPL